jgi:hypothetical protein
MSAGLLSAGQQSARDALPETGCHRPIIDIVESVSIARRNQSNPPQISHPKLSSSKAQTIIVVSAASTKVRVNFRS